jgi:hypothetical protein
MDRPFSVTAFMRKQLEKAAYAINIIFRNHTIRHLFSGPVYRRGSWS